jgi:YegS/Rv2252/BmrU family lipid kinase
MIALADLPLVIVNPASSGGGTKRAWPALAARLRDNFGPFACAFTTAPGDAKKIAGEAATAGRKLIIACGGDGTISEVANGIIAAGSSAELGILPRGSGGDFRKTIDLPARFEDAARALARGRARAIDVGEITFINHQGNQEKRYFINVASFGMGGEVVKRANSSNKTFGGAMAYAYATLAATLSYQCPEVWLKIGDHASTRLRIANVSIANGRYFGGGMKIAPHAKIDDGLLDVIVIKENSLTQTIVNAPRLYAGTHLSLPYVITSQCDIIAATPIDEKEIVSIEVDGEAPGRLPATFRVIHNALNVRCP